MNGYRFFLCVCGFRLTLIMMMNTNGLIDETMQPEHIVSAIHSRHAIGEFRILDLATSRERRVK